MKHKIILIILALFTGSVNANDLIISGLALTKHKTVTLKVFNPNSLDYETIANQKLDKQKRFSFQLEFEGENLYRIEYDEKEYLILSIEKEGKVNIERNSDGVEIKGSTSTVKMRAFRDENNALQEKYFSKLKLELDEAIKTQNQAKQATLQAEINKALEKYLIEFRSKIVELGTSPAAFYALGFSDFNKEIPFIEERLKAFLKEKPDSKITQALQLKVQRSKATQIGNRPMNISAKSIEGKAIELSEFKGKYVLIDFWASWCRQCRLDNPEWVKVYSEFNTQGLEILSISADNKEKAWKKAIKKDKIDQWEHIWDEGFLITKQFNITSFPQNLLLDRDGIIIGKNMTPEEVKEKLMNVL